MAQTADSALLSQVPDPDRLVAANTALQISENAAMVGGPDLTGVGCTRTVR